MHIRHWVKENSPSRFPGILEETPLEKVTTLVTNTLHISSRGLVSAFYNILFNMENLLQNTIFGGSKLLVMMLTGTNFYSLNVFNIHQAQTNSLQFNILHRTYYTPVKLHKCNYVSSVSQKCKMTDAGPLHMIRCCVLEIYH